MKKTKLVNGQKFERQYRTFSLRVDGAEGEGQRVEVDEKNRIIKNVSVSSEEPYDRYFGTEILLHNENAVDLTRIKKRAAPLLLNHDRDQLIGKPFNPRFEEKKLVVDLKFGQGSLAQECLRDLNDGLLTECSIGYDISKFEVDEEEETYTATRWEIFECSMVTIPADQTVGVGRQGETVPSKEIEIEAKKDIDTPRKSEKKDSHTRETRKKEKEQMETETETPPTADEKELKRAQATAKSEGAAEERKRVSDIQQLSKHFAEKGLGGRKIDTRELAAEFISREKDNFVQDFKDAVMIGTFKDVQPIQTPETERLDDDKSSGGSRIQIVREGDFRGAMKSIGKRFIESDGYKKQGKQRQRNFTVEIPDVANFRATAATTTITNFNGIVQLPQMIELGVQQATVADLLSQGTTNLSAVPYLQEDTLTPAATSVPEGTAKPEITWDWSQTSAPVKKIAVISKVTDELFADVPTIESYVNMRMRYMVEIEEDRELLVGTGGNDLTGIVATGGIQTQAKGGDTVPDAIRKAMTKVQSIGFFPPTGAVFHPNDWEAISLLKDSAGQYLAGGPFYAPYGNGEYVMFYRIWGLSVVVTTAMTENTGLVGNFKLGASIFRRQGITIDSTNSNEDDFKLNLIALRAEERLALAVWRPKAFCQVTGI